MEGGKRKLYENASSALFIDPVEEHGRQLGHLSQPAHRHRTTHRLLKNL